MEDDIETIIDEYFEADDEETKTICYEDLNDDFNINKLIYDCKDISIINDEEEFNSFSIENSIYSINSFEFYENEEISFRW